MVEISRQREESWRVEERDVNYRSMSTEKDPPSHTAEKFQKTGDSEKMHRELEEH